MVGAAVGAAIGAAAGSGWGRRALGAEVESAEKALRGGAEHVISVWLGGGMGQIDTFDPKAQGDPKAKKPGSYYDAIDTAVAGVQLCEHLGKLAPLMDRVTAVRTVHHEVIDEHAAATNRMHTGRPVSGTVTYPSIGSIIAHERGAASDAAPPYVLIGYPNVTRGPGFLGARHSYLYLTETGKGPAGLSLPDGITARGRLGGRSSWTCCGRMRRRPRTLVSETTTRRSLKAFGSAGQSLAARSFWIGSRTR